MKIIAAFIFCVGLVTVRADTTQTVVTDKQGQTHVTASVDSTTTPLPNGGTQTTASISQPNSSGKLTVVGTTTATTTPAVNGVTTTTRTESQTDVNGSTQPERQITDQTVKVSDHETHTDRTIQSFDHTRGAFAVTARESATTRTQGNTATTDTTIQKPTTTGWRVDSKTQTVETKAADGSIQREIIESRPSMYDRATGSVGLGDSLQPQTKILEREVTQTDGTKVVDRQTYRRDVNGDWQPTSFSIDDPRQPLNH